MKMIPGSKSQSHLTHGVALLIFAALVLAAQSMGLLQISYVIYVIGFAYVAINIIVDYKAGKATIRSALEYSLIAILAVILLTTYR